MVETGTLVASALKALQSVADDEGAPAAARVSAAVALLTHAGDVPGGAGKPLDGLSLAEIEAELAAISGTSDPRPA